FVLCVMGENPFGDYLDRLAREREIKSRKVVISYVSSIPELGACQVVFLAKSERYRVSAIVAQTRGKPILTIGDTPHFAQAGVLINFYEVDELIRFEINLEEAKRSGLKFSSNLMKLARIVSTGD